MAMLPYLAAYMGHAGIDSTLYYVHASPDSWTDTRTSSPTPNAWSRKRRNHEQGKENGRQLR